MSAPKCKECRHSYKFTGTSILCCALAASRAGECSSELGIPVDDERHNGECGPAGSLFKPRDILSQP